MGSVRLPNPQRPGLETYSHQIDLYWETGDPLSRYINIANAKWRGSAMVDQPDVMLLQQVRQKVAAHKAMMITNTGFTAGAVAAAMDDGIALHVVVPAVQPGVLHATDRSVVQMQLQEIAAQGKPLYTHRIIHRAHEPVRQPDHLWAGAPTPSPTTGQPVTKVIPSSGGVPGQNRAIQVQKTTSPGPGPRGRGIQTR